MVKKREVSVSRPAGIAASPGVRSSKAAERGIQKRRLERYRQRYVDGDKVALLEAVSYCLSKRIVAPNWIALEFSQRFSAWQAYHVARLDRAFDLAEHKNVAAKCRHHRLKFEIYEAVERARGRGVTVDDDLFERIGKFFDVGRTTVKTLMKAAKDELADQMRSQRAADPKADLFVSVRTCDPSLQDRIASFLEGAKNK